MFDLNLVERYKLVRVADVVDALDRFGIHENTLVSHKIGPIYPGIKMAGFAITAQARKVQEEMPLRLLSIQRNTIDTLKSGIKLGSTMIIS